MITFLIDYSIEISSQILRVQYNISPYNKMIDMQCPSMQNPKYVDQDVWADDTYVFNIDYIAKMNHLLWPPVLQSSAYSKICTSLLDCFTLIQVLSRFILLQIVPISYQKLVFWSTYNVKYLSVFIYGIDHDWNMVVFQQCTSYQQKRRGIVFIIHAKSLAHQHSLEES